MIIEKIEVLCSENNTTLTALCKEITGSSGNLPTWKKDKIRPDWLRAICLKFNISSDYLLNLPNPSNNRNAHLSQEECNALLRFNRLKEDYKIKAQSYMVDLYEKELANKSPDDLLDKPKYYEESVAADKPQKTGTDFPK